MEHLSPKTDTLSPVFIDATGALSDANIRWRIETETRNRHWYGVEGMSDNFATLTKRMNKEVFGDGKMPRRASVRGPILRDDTIFTLEPIGDSLEKHELGTDEGVLHGFTFVTIIQPNRETVLPALRFESLADEQMYFFPFFQIESLTYARESIPVQVITETFKHEAARIDELRRIAVEDDVEIKAQRLVFAQEQQRINGLFREIIDKGETFELTPDFYYYFEEGEMPNLCHDNTAAQQLGDLLGSAPIKGTFIGFSMPLLMQSDIAEQEKVYPGLIDIYEPCALFHAKDTNTTYAVPHTSLQELI